jgi:DNA-binding transcriptional MerR regulator
MGGWTKAVGEEVQHMKEDQHIEIPDVVRKLMDEHPQLKLFVDLLVGRIESLEKQNQELREQNHELRKQIRRLDKVLGEVIGPDIEERKESGTYIRVRPAQKGRNGDRNKTSEAHHGGVARQVPERVDVVSKVTMKKCPGGHNLRGPLWFEEHYVEDIVPAKVVKKKYLIAVYWDPVCRRKVRAKPKDVLPHERFGINLMLLVSFMRVLGITTKRIKMLLMELYGLKLSRSTILHMESRIAEEFGDYYEKLKDEIRRSKAVHYDDTGWPVNGANNWLWVFVGKAAAWYTIKDTRRGTVVKETLGEGYEGVACSDFYPSFDKLPYRQQKCLIHLLKDLRKAWRRGRPPSLQFRRFESKIRRIVQDAVRVHETVEDEGTRLRRKKLLEERILSLCSRRYTDRDCIRVCKLLKRHRKNLFTFLEEKEVHWNNNAAERAIRPSVVARKNSYGSRSSAGALNHAILMTVSETCRMRGMNFMDFGRSYLEARLDSSGLPKG